MLATRRHARAAPAAHPPEFSEYPAKDLKVPKGYAQAMRSECGELWGDSIAREWRGVLDAGDYRYGRVATSEELHSCEMDGWMDLGWTSENYIHKNSWNMLWVW